MNCHACLIVKSGCRFPWQHLYGLGLWELWAGETFSSVLFFYFLFSFLFSYHFENLKEVIQTEDDSLGDNVTDAALFFPGWMCEGCSQRKIRHTKKKQKKTQQLRWRHTEQVFPAHSSSIPSYFFINPTPTITITPLAITHNISADWPTCQKMTGIKYDTQSLCHHCREGHFPLQWNGGWCREEIFFFFRRKTGLMQHLSHLTFAALCCF